MRGVIFAALSLLLTVDAACMNFPPDPDNPCTPFVTYPIADTTDVAAVMNTITNTALAPMPHCLYYNTWSFLCQRVRAYQSSCSHRLASWFVCS